MGNKQLKIDYDAAQKVKTGLDNAEEDLEANANTMPSSGKYGEGDTYITFALTNFADALLCLWTWVTVLCQDIGDTSVGSGGDTCGLRLSGEL